MEKRKIYIFIAHLLIWILYVGQTVLDSSNPGKEVMSFLVFKQFTFYAIFAYIFYTNYFLLIPKLLLPKKYLKYCLALLLVWFVAYALFIGHGYLLYQLTDKIQYFSSRLTFYYPVIFYYIFFTVISFGARLLSDWFKTQALSEQLAKAELALLRHQISPHFLFNTLNNIYLLVKRKSDAAPEAVLKLSELLRYNLIDNIDEKVPLSKELEFIDSFIELQKLRMPYPKIIQYEKSIASSDTGIYPLLLIPFIENIFKHGLINTPEAYAKIDITVNAGILSLRTENLYKDQYKDETTGIGTNNVMKRLDLLYGSDYKLEIEDDGQHYISNLTIKIGSPNEKH